MRSAGRYADSEPLYRQALHLCSDLSSQDSNTGVILNNLAELYRVQGRLDDADLLYRQALERLEPTLGAEHPFVAMVLNNWAELMRFRGRNMQRAADSCRKALALLEKSLGIGHPQVAPVLNNLAEVYRAQGLYGKAETLYESALRIQKQALGEAHPATAATLNNLGLLYFQRGEYSRSQTALAAFLGHTAENLGPESCGSCNQPQQSGGITADLENRSDSGTPLPQGARPSGRVPWEWIIPDLRLAWVT